MATFVFVALLWPALVFSEFKPWLLFDLQSLRSAGRFLSDFLTPAHSREFLQLVVRDTWQTVAIATAGLTLALAGAALATLQQEARARNATLICSLHQVDMAREHFARIVGLRDGRIVFDARREAVTDAMIAALYQNEQHSTVVPQPHETPERLAVGACF